MESSKHATSLISGIVAVISFLSAFVIFGIYSAWFSRSIPFDQIPRQYLLAGGFLFLLGCVSLILTILDILMTIFVSSSFHKDGAGFRIRSRNAIIYGIYILLFPFFYAIIISHRKASAQNKVPASLLKGFQLFLIFILLFPLWVGMYYGLASGTSQIVKLKLGYYEDPIRIAGTGSMYPTFPKGTGKTIEEQTKEIVDIARMNPYPSGLNFHGTTYGGYTIGRGDILSFENARTDELAIRSTGEAAGFVKRVIGIPGDKIELRDGLVYLNDKPIKEPYTAKAHSTFGGDELPNCQTMVIPYNKLFVMGDNRKGSLDSRFTLGLISYEDIDHVIPFANQKGILDKNWRDVTHDLDDSSKIQLDRAKYVALINEKRKENNIPPLTYQPKLQKSAEIRAQAMFESNDISVDVQPKGKTRDDAFEKIGYFHHYTGELPTQGYFEAEELFDNQSEFVREKDFFLKKEYEEIGIAEVEGKINGCPTQIIVQHLAGYVPPNYDKDTIAGWRDLLGKLKDLQPAWEDLKKNAQFYDQNKTDIDRITYIISYRIKNIDAMVTDMTAGRWLTDEENKFMYEDEALAKEHTEIAKRLNAKTNN